MRLYNGEILDGAGGATAPLLASRTFGAVRGSRCYCSWYRRCICISCTAGGSCSARPFSGRCGTSDALSQAEYSRAGFAGDVPPGRATPAATAAARDRETLASSLALLAAYALAALSLGLLKALWPRHRDRWLWLVSAGWKTELDAYKEPELRSCRLVCDDRGYYVHPDTGSRNVRLLDGGRRFVVNLLFFMSAPRMLYLYGLSTYCPAAKCCCGSSLAPADSGHRSRRRVSDDSGGKGGGDVDRGSTGRLSSSAVTGSESRYSCDRCYGSSSDTAGGLFASRSY